MQKKIIALAIAGLASSAAFAQTNVQIYGIADAAVTWTNVNGGVTANAAGQAHGRDTLNVVSGGLTGSRLGFKGTEDLGNGLKAVFVLEYGLDLVNNVGVGVGNAASGNTLGGTAMARQQYVGLSGGFGTLSLGRQYAPGYYASANDAVMWSPALSPKAAAQTFLGGTIAGNNNARWDNSVNYVTNSLGGFTAQVIYQGGAQANELSTRESYGVGLKYAAGPVVVEYVNQNAKTLSPTVDGARLQENYLGATFDAKVVKVFASYQTMDKGDKAVAGEAMSGQAANVGVQVPVGKGTIVAAYGWADRNSNSRKNTTSYRGELNSINLTYLHSLSKRTTLYTGVTYTDQDVVNAGGVTTTVAAGINHAF